MNGRPIAALPALSPRALVPKPFGAPTAFPLCDPRTQYFYLGRGAVVRAAERLGLAGAEVLVPAYHHGVEVEALVAAGVRPRFYNVTRDLKVDLASLAAEVTPDTRGLYVIHFAGIPQPMPELVAFAHAHRLKVVEDCALALYSADGPRPLGTRGDAAIFCLYKTLPVPHGGALWMPRPQPKPELEPPGPLATLHQLASSFAVRLEHDTAAGRHARRALREAANLWRSFARLPADPVPIGGRRFVAGQERIGLSPVALAIARRLDAKAIVEARRRNFYALLSRLREVSPPIVHELASGVSPLFYPLWADDKRALQQALANDGIETIDFWREGSPLVTPGRFPDVDALRAHVLELPIHQDLDAADVARIAEAVRRHAGRRAERSFAAGG